MMAAGEHWCERTQVIMNSRFVAKVFAASMFAQGALFVGEIALASSGVALGVVGLLYGPPMRLIMRYTDIKVSMIGGHLPWMPLHEAVAMFLVVATGYSLIAVIAAVLVRVGVRRAKSGRVNALDR